MVKVKSNYQYIRYNLLRRTRSTLEKLKARLEPKIKQKEKPMPKALKVYHRKIDLKIQSAIVQLRYGSLSKFKTPLNSLQTVAKRTAIPYTTVHRTLHSFVTNGYLFKLGRKPVQKFNKLPADV